MLRFSLPLWVSRKLRLGRVAQDEAGRRAEPGRRRTASGRADRRESWRDALGSVQLAAEALINAMLRAAAQPGPESAGVYFNPTPVGDPLQEKRFNRAKVQRILQDALGPHAPLDAFTELRDSLDQQHRTTDEKLDGVLTRLDSLPQAPSAAPGPGIRMASVQRTGQGTLFRLPRSFAGRSRGA